MTKPIYKSDLKEAIHQSAQALFRNGVIDKVTMREFDESCLTIVPEFKPKDIQRLRKANGISQSVLARYLSISESTVEKWESGAKRPSAMALKLLSIVQKHGLEVLA